MDDAFRPAKWSAVFIAGHSLMIAKLLNERRDVEMTPRELDLYEASFHRHGFLPRQFLRLLEKADPSAYK